MNPDEKNQQFFTRLRKTMEGNVVSQDDFVSAFKEVLRVATEIEKKLIQKIDGKLSEIKSGDDGESIKGDKGDKGDKGEKGERGATFIAMRGAKGDDGKDGENGSDDTPEQTRDKLESIQEEEEKLAISAVAHLEEKLKELEKKVGMSRGSVGGFNYSSMDFHIVDDETPTGSGTAFTIKNPPNPVSSFKLYRGGARQRVTEDYTLSGTTLTLNVALVSGEVLLCDYRV